MTGPHDRRGFLRGLAALPFVGGAVTLIGNPTEAAVPVTDAMLRRYVSFISREHALALQELAERETPHRFEPGQPSWHPPMFWIPETDIMAQVALEGAAPSSRAAIILSAIGVPLA